MVSRNPARRILLCCYDWERVCDKNRIIKHSRNGRICNCKTICSTGRILPTSSRESGSRSKIVWWKTSLLSTNEHMKNLEIPNYSYNNLVVDRLAAEPSGPFTRAVQPDDNKVMTKRNTLTALLLHLRNHVKVGGRNHRYPECPGIVSRSRHGLSSRNQQRQGQRRIQRRASQQETNLHHATGRIGVRDQQGRPIIVS